MGALSRCARFCVVRVEKFDVVFGMVPAVVTLAIIKIDKPRTFWFAPQLCDFLGPLFNDGLEFLLVIGKLRRGGVDFLNMIFESSYLQNCIVRDALDKRKHFTRFFQTKTFLPFELKNRRHMFSV